MKASIRNLRVSPIKVNLLMKEIRNMSAAKAMDLLKFSHKRIARDIYKLVRSAVANAENNFSADIDNLWIDHAYVGRGMALKRMNCRAKGRGNMIKKPFSHVYVVLSDKKEEVLDGPKG